MHMTRAQIVGLFNLATSLGMDTEYDVNNWQDSSPELLVQASDPMFVSGQRLFRLPTGGGSLELAPEGTGRNYPK